MFDKTTFPTYYKIAHKFRRSGELREIRDTKVVLLGFTVCTKMLTLPYAFCFQAESLCAITIYCTVSFYIIYLYAIYFRKVLLRKTLYRNQMKRKNVLVDIVLS